MVVCGLYISDYDIGLNSGFMIGIIGVLGGVVIGGILLLVW